MSSCTRGLEAGTEFPAGTGFPACPAARVRSGFAPIAEAAARLQNGRGVQSVAGAAGAGAAAVPARWDVRQMCVRGCWMGFPAMR